MFDLQKFLSEFKESKPETKDDWIRVYASMIVHTRGVKPTELLEIKRPNEPKDVRDYRLANYRAITKHGINQAIDAVYRVLSSSNYSIVPSASIKDYLEETSFKFLGEKQKFHSLFFKTILRLIFDDPNGLLVWMPENPDDPALPPIDTVETEKINVKPVYVCCKNIVHLTDEVLAYEAGKMLVEIPTTGNKKKIEEHPWYFICSLDFIWKYVPYWDISEKKVKYKTEDWYSLSISDSQTKDELKFPSAIWHPLGGNVSMNEKELRFYDSFYGCYVPFADECICAFSDNSAVRVRYNFPFTSVKGQMCVTCKGTTKTLNDKGEKVTCGTCNGSGKTVPFTPFGHYVKEPPARVEEEAYASSPAIEFYSPDIGILENSYTTWENLLLKAKETVNLIFIDEAQSGVAKEIDREQKYETLIKITQNFFWLIRWSLNIIEAYRVPSVGQRKENKVVEPETFSIKTEGQLMQELNDMTAKETPQVFIATTSKQISDKIYANNEEAKIIVEILSKWDVLYGKSASSISMAKANGGATQRDVVRNIHGYAILSELAAKEDLSKLDYETIVIKANALLSLMLPQDMLSPIEDSDNLGKIPLAMQQLALARERAKTAGDLDLVNKLGAKMDELLAQI